jgi:hypothetical protein
MTEKDNVGVDEKVADDLVRASELYRVAEYDIAVLLIDKAIIRAMQILLEKNGENRLNLQQMSSVNLVDLAVKKGLITTSTLREEIEDLGRVRNNIAYGIEEQIDPLAVKRYLDIAYELAGTIPYREELSKKFYEYRSRKIVRDAIAFEKEVLRTIRETYGSEYQIHTNMPIGSPGRIFRADAVLVDKSGEITLVETKYSAPDLHTIYRIQDAVKEAKSMNARIKETWLVVNEHKERPYLTKERLLEKGIILKKLTNGRIESL